MPTGPGAAWPTSVPGDGDVGHRQILGGGLRVEDVRERAAVVGAVPHAELLPVPGAVAAHVAVGRMDQVGGVLGRALAVEDPSYSRRCDRQQAL
ncbi:hypothetical protein ACFWY6_02695 [Streptomyces sp. NPDC059037]|uniref:hypothetical protein n=1 Tax=Streptomyces sp. NPDC059037 TaxID=3346710 RepID=UPI0036736708